MSDHFSRRSFVKASAAFASAAMPALSQSNQVSVGVLGAGGRGYYLTERLYAGNRNVKVLSVCDTYQGNLNRIKDRVQTMGKNTPEATADYTKVLSNRDVQMVIIATPEHLHHRMTLDAIAAGKHIYVEKPLAHTIEEGEEILKAAQAAKVKIQVGTQNRSNSLYGMAKQMISQGIIGECHYVRAFWYRNALPGGAPAWRYTIPKDAAPENTDWQRFLGEAPKRDFDKQRYYQWRLYWDYSGGISTDLLVHQTDITNFVLGKTTPDTCVASGGIYRWTDANDDREVPDTMSAIYEYGDKFHLNYSCYFGNDNFGYGEQFCGNEGTVEVLNRSILRFTPQKFNGQPFANRKDAVVELPGNDNLAVEAHIRNLVEAVQGKAQLIAPVEVGQQAAISGHMATLALRNKKMVRWDGRSRKAIIG
ncbi:MAG: Gfo/Idh/MocA family oxidoreductase [Acidobacteria bacterium]|nr:Gfo/Idh/MocA family oxidoreductase [Acidobacteriota bacterium]